MTSSTKRKPKAPDETCVYVAGRKGMGKSTFLGATVQAHAALGYRFGILDSTREWSRFHSAQVRVFPATHWSVDAFLRYLFSAAPVIGVIDEVDRYAPNHSGGLPAGSALFDAVQYGRHLNTGLLLASRRPARVHADIPSLADAIVFFQLTSPRDLLWVSDVASDETAEEVRNLERGDYVLWRPGDN